MKSSSIQEPQNPEFSVLQNRQKTKSIKYKSYRNRHKKKANSGRKCKVCGKDPYPNYFFCPSCHNSLEVYEEKDEY